LNVHAPETHAGAALATTAGHMTPQLPQLFGSVSLLVHVPPHESGVGAVQPAWQADPTQRGVLPVQAWPQTPQLFLSLVSSTQLPPQDV